MFSMEEDVRLAISSNKPVILLTVLVTIVFSKRLDKTVVSHKPPSSKIKRLGMSDKRSLLDTPIPVYTKASLAY